jgi:cholesterol oxidase
MTSLTAPEIETTATPALYSLEGVSDATIDTFYYTTKDQISLSMFRFQKANRRPDSPAALLVHCHSLSTDQFIMPEHYNIVRYLHDHGYEDVWSVDLRNSNRHPYDVWAHGFNMDDIALFDYPPALEIIRKHIGDRPLHAICQGLNAVTFSMSLAARMVTGFASVIVNSASLIPQLPRWSLTKQRFLLPPFQFFFQYCDPSWSQRSGFVLGKALAKIVGLFHSECDQPACHMGSFMYGSGRPALFNHENLSDITHKRIGMLFGPTRLVYATQMAKSTRAGGAVKLRPNDPKYAELPDDYTKNIELIEEPILFVNGEDNRVFFRTNINCYNTFKERLGDRNIHELFVVPDYGHIDIFMGKNAHRDVFPRFVEWMNQHNG